MYRNVVFIGMLFWSLWLVKIDAFPQRKFAQITKRYLDLRFVLCGCVTFLSFSQKNLHDTGVRLLPDPLSGCTHMRLCGYPGGARGK